jgi:hypothetical protein
MTASEAMVVEDHLSPDTPDNPPGNDFANNAISVPAERV